MIEELYGFRCECLKCESSGKTLLESDKKRMELKMRQKGAKFIFSDPVAGLRLVSERSEMELRLTMMAASRCIRAAGRRRAACVD